MRHFAFFEALGNPVLPEEERHAILAGLLVLRFFDDWVNCGDTSLVQDLSFTRILAHVDEIPGTWREHRACLRALMEAIAIAPEADPRNVAEQCLRYGTLLEEEGRWPLAFDLHQTFANTFSSIPNHVSHAFARQREGVCARHIGDLRHARWAYKQAIAIARHGDFEEVRLRAMIGLTNIIWSRGNLPRAESLFTKIIRRARRKGSRLDDVRSRACHSRGALYHDLRRYEKAIADLHKAYRLAKNPHTKNIILGDLAACFYEIGYRQTAAQLMRRVVNDVHAGSARTVAVYNLIEYATNEGDVNAFKQYCVEWDNLQSLATPRATSFAKLIIARGIERFYGPERALDAFRDAFECAQRHQQYQRMHEAEEDLKRVEQGLQAPAPSAPVALPLSQIDEIDRVAHELEELYESTAQ